MQSSAGISDSMTKFSEENEDLAKMTHARGFVCRVLCYEDVRMLARAGGASEKWGFEIICEENAMFDWNIWPYDQIKP